MLPNCYIFKLCLLFAKDFLSSVVPSYGCHGSLNSSFFSNFLVFTLPWAGTPARQHLRVARNSGSLDSKERFPSPWENSLMYIVTSTWLPWGTPCLAFEFLSFWCFRNRGCQRTSHARETRHAQECVSKASVNAFECEVTGVLSHVHTCAHTHESELCAVSKDTV